MTRQLIQAITVTRDFHLPSLKMLLSETLISRAGGHYPTTIDGPKIALRSMEEGYFVPGIVANMPLNFLVDTGSNVSISCKDLLDVWPQEHFPSLTPVDIQLQVNVHHSMEKHKSNSP